ncbi:MULTISPECIES: HlyD family secretion protein [Sphingobium]|uniref:HlyD family secretion protein n=1 Tax=Sphingobium TaxID=165695 RepID=UPI000AED99AA|nr:MULTISPECIES: HlyD family secretion protein [Sphingobium]
MPRVVLMSAAAVAVALGGTAWLTSRPSAESTDDAYIAADTTSVAPKIRGLVEAVLVRDNQTVHRGDPLVRIDPEEFDARVVSAQADLAGADAAVADARAALISLHAEERLATANIAATRTAIRATDAEAGRSDVDRRRYEALVATGAVARAEADRYRTAAIGARQGAARARADLIVAERQAGVTSARRGTLDAALAKAVAQRRRAAAAFDLARQDQRHTLVRAPINGVVGNRQARVGDYVQAGSRLLSLVPLHDLYVIANFKETQTRDMRIGQPVSIDVDALRGNALKGHVESFAPGSGSSFALLPFEPGTGNFTKIVQRVPVRIRLDPDQAGLASLRPGLSVTARVRLSQ